MASSNSEIASKIGAPTKRSVFERQKAESDAKKAREKAETAAVYEDFVKSFEDDGVSKTIPNKITQVANNGIPGKRHFTSSSLKSGPGSLGPVPNTLKNGPGSLGPTQSSYGRKRPFDDYNGRYDRDKDQGMFSYDEKDVKSRMGDDLGRGYVDKDDGNEKAAAKPTLHLSSLPPGISSLSVQELVAYSPLVVENVRILPSTNFGTERKSISAILTLAAETPATDIDTVVSQLQNKYMGYGFKLSISRHLSSVALTTTGALNTLSKSINNLPFGAKPIPQQKSLSRAPPPGQNYGRFAPPTSYTSSTPYGPRSNLPPTQVIVQPPSDIKQVKLIHKTLEALLTYGPEFEALLMSRPQIQKDERWAWLWDSRSIGGVYYRWRLWEIITNSNERRKLQNTGYSSSIPVETPFQNQSPWLPPEEPLKFEFTTNLNEFISDDDYNSSDEEDDEGGGIARRYNDHNINAITQSNIDSNDGMGYLNPLAKTKLVHLLSRLPENNAKLRKGDVARVTAFAIEHAGSGAEEIAALVTRNVIQPFHYLGKDLAELQDGEEDIDTHQITSTSKPDLTPASLVGLYMISDILSSSASAGVRHAWRYRALFETALRKQQVLEKLGRADRDQGWGKLKAEKWKRSIHSILSLWETWCVFPQASHETFVNSFDNPPLTKRERMQVEADEKRRAEDEAVRIKSNNRWRNVEADDANGVKLNNRNELKLETNDPNDIDGTTMIDEDMEMDEDQFIDENIDGISMEDSDEEEEGKQNPDQNPTVQPVEPVPPKVDIGISAKRQRPKAVDMFADESD